MRAVRALAKRVARLEQAGKPRPSPFVIFYGSFDAFADTVLPGYLDGTYDKGDMIAVIAALRNWETDGTWQQAYAS